MLDEINEAFSHLVDCVSRVEVETIDGKGAARLVGIADGISRCGDSLRTVAVGQVERTNGWKGEGARSSSEWLSSETDCAQYEAQSVVILANQLQHLPTTQAALLSGVLSNAQAVEVARGAIVAPNTETQLLNLAEHVTVRDLRDATARVIAGATDEGARHKQIHKTRSLRSWRDPDGAFILKGRMADTDS